MYDDTDEGGSGGVIPCKPDEFPSFLRFWGSLQLFIGNLRFGGAGD